MSVRKNLNLLVATGLLFTLASCGENKSSNHQQKEQSCSELDCLSSINWKIVLQGKAFPDKARIDVNGTTVLNECVSKQKFAIDRTSEPQSLSLENFYVPKKGELKIDVIDMGNHCDSESTFISESNVEFEVTKDQNSSELLIRL